MERLKYPRTPHLPWSPGFTQDDVVGYDLSLLYQSDVVVTLKMDGEATTIYPDGYVHARSIDSPSHPSRDWVKGLAANIGFSMPDYMRICGENLFAKHSIGYDELPSYFMLYSIWVKESCYNWDLTVQWAAMLGLPTVPEIYRGPMLDEQSMTKLFEPYSGTHEGYVVRTTEAFHRDDFGKKIFKWVRPNHVQTDEHWATSEITKNKLRKL